MTYASIGPALSRRLPQNWSAVHQQITRQYRDWARRRQVFTQVFNELSASSDRDLADLAISRHDIRDIAAKAAHMASREYSL